MKNSKAEMYFTAEMQLVKNIIFGKAVLIETH